MQSSVQGSENTAEVPKVSQEKIALALFVYGANADFVVNKRMQALTL
jgi:hypothetical protein